MDIGMSELATEKISPASTLQVVVGLGALLVLHSRCISPLAVRMQQCVQVSINGPDRCIYSVSCKYQRRHERCLLTHAEEFLQAGARHFVRCIPNEHPTKSPR